MKAQISPVPAWPTTPAYSVTLSWYGLGRLLEPWLLVRPSETRYSRLSAWLVVPWTEKAVDVSGEAGVVQGVLRKLGRPTLHTVKFDGSGKVETMQLAKLPGGQGRKFYVEERAD